MTNPVARGGGALLLALTCLNVLNFGDRYLIVAFSTSIVAELKLSNLEYGLLTGIVFTGIYTVMGLFTGSLADRVHRPRLIALGLALWSGLTAATGLARGFAQMAAARLFIGVGEACLTPAALSLLAERLPPARRALASGFYYMGYPIGIGGSFIFASHFGAALGWRGGFMLLGTLGVVAAVLVITLMRDPRRSDRAHVAHSFADSFRGIGHELRTNPAFTLTLLGSTLAVITQGAGILDLLWWVKERGHPVAQAQGLLGWIFMLGGAAGASLGGIGSDWAQRHWAGGRLKFLALVFLLASPLVVGYRLVDGQSPAFYALAFCGSMVMLAMFGPALSAIQSVVPAQHRGSAISMFVLFTSLIGAGGGNAAAGWLADAFIKSGTPEPLTHALLWMLVPGLLSIPVFYVAARYQARHAAAAELDARAG